MAEEPDRLTRQSERCEPMESDDVLAPPATGHEAVETSGLTQEALLARVTFRNLDIECLRHVWPPRG